VHSFETLSGMVGREARPRPLGNPPSKEDKARFCVMLYMLPPFELSYAIDRHRKVEADTFLVAPRGDRTLLWFCSEEGEDGCFSFRLDGKRRMHPSRELGCFSHELCAGTLLYGVVQVRGSGRVFLCEDVLWYKGKPVGRLSLQKKIPVLENMFERDLGEAPSVRYLDVCLPMWTECLAQAEQCAASCAYACRGVFAYASHLPGLRPLVLDRPRGGSRCGPPGQQTAVLVAQASVHPDIYTLYVQGQGALESVGRAVVPSLKTSVLMNGLLRKIKENSNLDLLEESDSDEEFEDVSDDKYVFPDRHVAVRCRYSARHGGWEPLEAVGIGGRVTRAEELRGGQGFSVASTHGKKARNSSKAHSSKAHSSKVRGSKTPGWR